MAIINKVVCDVCEQEIHIRGYAELKASWGYGSPYDSQGHSLVLCHDCYEGLIKDVRDKVWIVKDTIFPDSNLTQGLD